MQTTDAVVRLKTLSGQWETCGSDRLRGIVPEGIQLQANAYGPDTASFTLRRDAAAIWPDLQAFTPVEIEIGGVVVWDGFISQTPTTDSDGGSFNVNCKGWQYHLDDDSVEKVWIHSSLPAWRDMTSFPTYSPAQFPPGTATSVGDGGITLGWAGGNYITQNTFSAVVLDLGPYNNATGISLSWEVPPSATNVSYSDNILVYARANSDISKFATVSNDAWSASYMKANKSTCTLSGSFPVASRYVMVGVAFVGTTNQAAVNYTIKLNNITVTTDPAVTRTNYPQVTIPIGTVTNSSGSATFTTSTAHGFAVGDYVAVSSVLPRGYNDTYKVTAVPSTTKFTVSTATTGNVTAAGAVNKSVLMTKRGNGGATASDVVADSVKYAPLLSSATTNIKPTTFSLPNFGSIDGAQTAREYIDAANSYHDYIVKLNPGSKTLTFKPRPSIPTVAIGRWGGATFEDAAAASSEEIYNKVIVEGDGPDGTKLRVTRYAGMQSQALAKTGIPSTLYNGQFATTTGWTPSGSGSVSTVTVPQIGTATPELKWIPATSSSTANTLSTNLSSGFTFKAGTTYTLSFSMTSYFDYFTWLAYQPQVDFGALSTSDYATVLGTTDPYYGSMPTTITYDSVRTVAVAWTPLSDISSSNVSIKMTDNFGYLNSNPGVDFYLFDDLNITSSTATLVDRYGFFRTKTLQVNGPMTTATGQQLGDAYLANHMSTPLKGNVTVSGSGARDYLAGNSVHPSQLLLEVGEKIHLSHRIDPDTGSQGRDGDIAQVSYDHTSQTAQVSIDNQRTRFEAFLARLAVVTNNRLGR